MSITNDSECLWSRKAFSRAETAKILNISESTLDRLVGRGLLRPVRATRRPLFTEKEIDRFLHDTSEAIAI